MMLPVAGAPFFRFDFEEERRPIRPCVGDGPIVWDVLPPERIEPTRLRKYYGVVIRKHLIVRVYNIDSFPLKIHKISKPHFTLLGKVVFEFALPRNNGPRISRLQQTEKCA